VGWKGRIKEVVRWGQGEQAGTQVGSLRLRGGGLLAREEQQERGRPPRAARPHPNLPAPLRREATRSAAQRQLPTLSPRPSDRLVAGTTGGRGGTGRGTRTQREGVASRRPPPASEEGKGGRKAADKDRRRLAGWRRESSDATAAPLRAARARSPAKTRPAEGVSHAPDSDADAAADAGRERLGEGEDDAGDTPDCLWTPLRPPGPPRARRRTASPWPSAQDLARAAPWRPRPAGSCRTGKGGRDRDGSNKTWSGAGRAGRGGHKRGALDIRGRNTAPLGICTGWWAHLCLRAHPCACLHAQPSIHPHQSNERTAREREGGGRRGRTRRGTNRQLAPRRGALPPFPHPSPPTRRSTTPPPRPADVRTNAPPPRGAPPSSARKSKTLVEPPSASAPKSRAPPPPRPKDAARGGRRADADAPTRAPP
jgi:hypothetical protein